MDTEFDVIVIGAGPAGEVVAGRIADRGGGALSVAIVERELVGGECSYYACMPSKALLRPAEVLAEAARVPGAAEALAGGLDVSAVLERRDGIIGDLDDSAQLAWLRGRGVELIRGEGRLAGERLVQVGGRLIAARQAVVVAVGTGPLLPPVPGLAESGAWSNREITTASEVPAHLIVVGGGAVGVEMAQAWSSLGSKVTVIEAEPRLLPREEPFAGAEVGAALESRGVTLALDTMMRAVSHDNGTITVSLDGGEAVSGDRLLVAIGRRPLTDDLGLETVGLDPAGYIGVGDTLQVPGREWLYAVGDVNGRSLLTHSGKYQARLAADHILGAEIDASVDGPGAPRVIFTEPQVAAVGLTLAGAVDAGIGAAVAIDVPTTAAAGASFHGRGAPGTSRFVVDSEREVLVGATFVGPDVAEMLQAATVAVVAEVPLATLARAIAPFPTRSELWLEFLEAYELERPEADVHSRRRELVAR
ncbi:MAG: NAD(P)/FAD-dependent oxidoreductase [Thermoleophilia bacterium]|nr:NAD(P)/FAD-dependent oxidoreductase [Thermoleophilia bacterium]